MSFKAALSIFASLAITALLSAGSALAEPIKLVGFGDSLMAGYQLPASDAFPVKLEAALREKGFDVEIANAGVSGDTSSGGLARLDWSIPDGTKGVILELGANDALRGIPPEQTEKNLDAMLTRLKERGIAVLLAGMMAPPNMGPDYGERFNGIYQRMADKHGVALYPFFLDGVVTHANLQLEDGMHPNSEGVDVMVRTMLPATETFLKSITAGE
ncbi:arylesterase [Shinella kummerowiae]|jgi:acyl-CoA thioesterase-1|uniref:Arylesterase n=1 Tax=Shinella kummerowiae TaxID=417745 RepID=A0A6N8SL99_9HYPH|nr:arylesterase [Shinella kummerowiae]MXN47672.1 arylesterase [Shinella kummerowiae]